MSRSSFHTGSVASAVRGLWGRRSAMNSSGSVRRVTGLLREFIGIDHGPAELEEALDIVTMTSLRSAPA